MIIMELFIVITLAFFLALIWLMCCEKAYYAFCAGKKIAWFYVFIIVAITFIGFNYDYVVGKIMGFG